MLFFLLLTGRLIHSLHRYSSFQLFKVPQRAAPPFTLTNSSLSQVSEHQPTQQSIEHHQTVFSEHMALFSSCPQSLLDPEEGGE